MSGNSHTSKQVVLHGTSTNQDHACDLGELKSLSQTKTYTTFADPILESMQHALKYKKLTDKAALLWFFLCKEVKFDKEWSIRKSIRRIAETLGWSKSTAQEAVKCLELNHMIVVEREGRINTTK